MKPYVPVRLRSEISVISKFHSLIVFPWMIERKINKMKIICTRLGSETATSLLSSVKIKVNQSHYRPEVPRGFQEVKVLILRDNGPGWW